MIIDGAFNHERVIECLQALVRDGGRRHKKVFLVADNLGVHHCKPVKAWLVEHVHHAGCAPTDRAGNDVTHASRHAGLNCADRRGARCIAHLLAAQRTCLAQAPYFARGACCASQAKSS